jgi:hypothetical protein
MNCILKYDYCPYTNPFELFVWFLFDFSTEHNEDLTAPTNDFYTKNDAFLALECYWEEGMFGSGELARRRYEGLRKQIANLDWLPDELPAKQIVEIWKVNYSINCTFRDLLNRHDRLVTFSAG